MKPNTQPERQAREEENAPVPAEQGAPAAPGKETPAAPGPRARSSQRRSRQQSVVHYIIVLFAAAFLLLALSYLMERRQNAQDMDSLNESIMGLKDSVSAMQKVEDLYAENARLQEQLQELEGETEGLEEDRAALETEKEALEQTLRNTSAALDWFWQIDEAYVRGRYTLCRELMESLEWNGLAEYLPRESVTDNQRFSPYDRYQEIREALT